ncbi:hypothetical protein LSH36_381g01001 [Paralvinella palmiformis]|uniref:Uncharacterized protein n=1 Tax=Paralvinella palmiformis TaxID=53620 RepID=A0AAD9JDX3_9ANNE|nr:hypothetical protein LSH36_381g01001 [Paralvinella palmiformis]
MGIYKYAYIYIYIYIYPTPRASCHIYETHTHTHTSTHALTLGSLIYYFNRILMSFLSPFNPLSPKSLRHNNRRSEAVNIGQTTIVLESEMALSDRPTDTGLLSPDRLPPATSAIFV